MEIHTQASIHIKASREKVFSFATNNENLPKVFKGFGPIPAIEKISLIEGDRPMPGSVRLIENSDGSKMRERILQFSPPLMQEYVLESGFKPPFSWMVKSAKGHWTFEQVGDEVKVVWDYSFNLKNPIASIITLPIAKIFFQEAQLRCLQNIKMACEK